MRTSKGSMRRMLKREDFYNRGGYYFGDFDRQVSMLQEQFSTTSEVPADRKRATTGFNLAVEVLHNRLRRFYNVKD